MASATYEKFKRKLAEFSHLKTALALLSWDQEVNMPPKGAELRAQTMASLASLLHNQFLSAEFEALLAKVKKEGADSKLSAEESASVREIAREFELEKKLPESFVKEFAELTSRSQVAWVTARQKSDFASFQPFLEKMVAMCRQEAKLLGYKQTPYDALLDLYEPGLTTEDMEMTLGELRDFLVPFIKKIQKAESKPDPKILAGEFAVGKQKEFNKTVIGRLGFDFEAGRMDVSAHPFATGFTPQDVRLTTRYRTNECLTSLLGAIHESGHGMYEQGLPAENFGTPLAESISLGIHESQSRLWENLVGRSKPFWQYFLPKLSEVFPEPFRQLSFENFYRALNFVEPGLIRVDADEVTYNLHIIIRFEIEKALLDGTLEVRDLPKIWNEKVKTYLGLDVPDDARGVLQDVHWSMGSIGYFPTYSLGNLYSAQFFQAAKKALPNLDGQMSIGDFSQLKQWLNQNIHIYGKMYSAKDICVKATGEELTSKYFIDYLRNKYTEIYNL